jgi:hypothetical protein
MFVKGPFYMRAILIFIFESSINLPALQTVTFKMTVHSVPDI